MRHTVLATLLASTTLNASVAPADHGQDIRFREKVDVERVVIDARAVDGRGQPILGLAATNFQVKVDGKPVALESATWVTGTPPDELLTAVEGDAAAFRAAASSSCSSRRTSTPRASPACCGCRARP